MKYVVYVAVANMPQSATKGYVDEVKESLKDLFDQNDKVAYITLRGEDEQTRIEALPS